MIFKQTRLSRIKGALASNESIVPCENYDSLKETIYSNDLLDDIEAE